MVVKTSPFGGLIRTAMQAATPSSADASKRADLMRRLNNIISSGVAGYTGLHAEVWCITNIGHREQASRQRRQDAMLEFRPCCKGPSWRS